MPADDATNNNGMALERPTPVTNNRGEEEEGGSSLRALVGEQPDPGFLLERGSLGCGAGSSFPVIVMPWWHLPWTQVSCVDSLGCDTFRGTGSEVHV